MGDGQWANSGGFAALARLPPRRDQRWWARAPISKVSNPAAEAALHARVSRMGLLPGPAAEIDGVIASIVQAGLCHGINKRWRGIGPNEPEQRQERCGDELLGQILSISHPSLRRYADGERRCPDGVAARLHWLALVVEALEGSYNPIGIRRWLARPASAQSLGGSDAGGHGGQLMAVAPYRLGFRVCDRRFPFLWSGPGQRSGRWTLDGGAAALWAVVVCGQTVGRLGLREGRAAVRRAAAVRSAPGKAF